MIPRLRGILIELREHSPFTIFGAATGIVIALVMTRLEVSRGTSEVLFDVLHPVHVLLSAMVIAGLHRLHRPGRLWMTILVGFVGSVGLATLSDCLIPYAAEWLLNLPYRAPHLGFLEIWWAVNPAALVGIAVTSIRPRTRAPHAGHVLVSTWASLFHITMALSGAPGAATLALIGLFLFLAVWIPCCVSDIVFPMLFAGGQPPAAGMAGAARGSGRECRSGVSPDM